MPACPKCGRVTEPEPRICPGCGVIMSKVRAKSDGASKSPAGPPLSAGRPLPPPLSIPAPPRSAARPSPLPRSVADDSDDGEATPSGALRKVGVAAAVAIALLFAMNRGKGEPEKAAPARSGFGAGPTPDGGQKPETIEEEGGLAAADVAFLNTLTARLSRERRPPAEAEIEQAEKILAANRSHEALRKLMMSFYLARAHGDLQAGSMVQVDATLLKMRLLNDADPEIYLFEIQARAKQGDWGAALAAAERHESLAAATPRVSYITAVALEKLGRRQDAVGVLARPIFDSCPQTTDPPDVSACHAADEMRRGLASLAATTANGSDGAGSAPVRERAALVVDASKNQIQSETFDIRFDGDNQSGVARDVLFVLNRAYTRLADIYYDRPRRKIPVVLHSQQDYYSKTGAPWWSGGVYNSHNGAIQIPIRGMPSTLPREMEDTLVHELSHAFVDEMAGGYAGRELQEGLAQYMEGKRIESEMTPADLKKLANSSGRSVGAVYMNALVFVQVLVQSRGQGMVNQLLQSMKEAGSEDGGFRKTFGQSVEAMKGEVFDTFKRRYK
jgi:hypothetical protein